MKTQLNIGTVAKERGVSKAELARLAGQEYGTTVRYCRIRSLKTVNLLVSYAKALGCASIEDLLTEPSNG